MKVTEEWPKKLSAGKYARRWHVDRHKQSIINDIKNGKLPGTFDGQWYVWVNSDLSPAFGYEGPQASPTPGSSTGNELADSILAQMGLRKAS